MLASPFWLDTCKCFKSVIINSYLEKSNYCYLCMKHKLGSQQRQNSIVTIKKGIFIGFFYCKHYLKSSIEERSMPSFVKIGTKLRPLPSKQTHSIYINFSFQLVHFYLAPACPAYVNSIITYLVYFLLYFRRNSCLFKFILNLHLN